MRLKLKQIIRFVDTIDTVEYNAKKTHLSSYKTVEKAVTNMIRMVCIHDTYSI